MSQCLICKHEFPTDKRLGQHARTGCEPRVVERSSKFHAKSELVTLLNARFQELGLDNGEPYNKPSTIPDERIIAAFADSHRSDPFAALRIRHHLAQGYVLPSDVLKDSRRVE